MDDLDVTSSLMSDRIIVEDKYVYQSLCYCCCQFGVYNVFRKNHFPTACDAPFDPHGSEDGLSLSS